MRYSHGYRSESVKRLITAALAPWQQHTTISWQRPCEPYYTAGGGAYDLLAALEEAIYQSTQSYPQLSTSGGTSDGRFLPVLTPKWSNAVYVTTPYIKTMSVWL